MAKLSEKLLDAYMIGDNSEVDRIKDLINIKQAQLAPQKKTNTIKINSVINDEKASAAKIYDFLNKMLENDWWEWEIETLEQVLWIKYGAALEGVNRDKVLAIRHTCRSDNPFADWYEFNQVALSFSGSVADFEYLKSPSPGMVINCVKILNHIRPDRKSFFSNDVLKYICIVLLNDGIYIPPPSLAMLIGKHMKEMVSTSTKSKWADILRKYQKVVSNPNVDIEEDNMVDIQAKRLVNAEAASLVFG